MAGYVDLTALTTNSGSVDTTAVKVSSSGEKAKVILKCKAAAKKLMKPHPPSKPPPIGSVVYGRWLRQKEAAKRNRQAYLLVCLCTCAYCREQTQPF